MEYIQLQLILILKDIELSMSLGFNGARLHEKIFEPRFLYWADKLGYIVWENMETGDLNYYANGFGKILAEWLEAVQRDFNHPSIIGWCLSMKHGIKMAQTG